MLRMRLDNQIPWFTAVVKTKIMLNMQIVTMSYREDLKSALDVPPARSGILYSSTGRWGWRVAAAGKRFHRASAPGEAPAKLSGTLIGSIQTDVPDEPGDRAYVTSVYSTDPKARWMEEGLSQRRPYPMAKRPAWFATLMKYRRKYGRTACRGFHRRRET